MKKIVFISRYFAILSVISVLLFSCKKNEITPQKPDSESNPVLSYIKKLGYNDGQIKDIGDEYLVDGDILFSKNSNPDLSIADGPKAEQYGTANYVGYDVQPNILVYVDASMNAYLSEINGAIALWNNVINCRVKFAITTASTAAQIRITNANLGSGVCGAAYFPVNGQPGGLVRININQIAGNSFAQRQRTIAHELGHCIGFRHTNWQSGEPQSGVLSDNGAYFDAMHILGTPTGGDPNSIMNGGQCGSGATTLSSFDILAVQFLYPANPPVAGTVPVFRYYSRATWDDHFYTTYLGELGNGANNDYIFEGIGFFAFPNQVANSIPVYRWYLPQSGDHFYTANPNEIPSGNYEGIAFYAYSSAINGAVPVHRYYNGSFDDHFYTKNQNEMSTIPGYTYEGIGWYAY
ncbi:M57 family metalloprotease [Chitinophaga tropicalis]|uniref:DUF5648 domain-containing protein n=1 Tax=Chitinophaga tropicalis TaxID=2683588 RepID=A0A7K1U2N9_9BACT|nr:M57 family metalloprotease [Chitinophaga tropicalis]MVT08275.1 hypothetical protein [Chitinophaga tropicalis]